MLETDVTILDRATRPWAWSNFWIQQWNTVPILLCSQNTCKGCTYLPKNPTRECAVSEVRIYKTCFKEIWHWFTKPKVRKGCQRSEIVLMNRRKRKTQADRCSYKSPPILLPSEPEQKDWHIFRWDAGWNYINLLPLLFMRLEANASFAHKRRKVMVLI